MRLTLTDDKLTAQFGRKLLSLNDERAALVRAINLAHGVVWQEKL